MKSKLCTTDLLLPVLYMSTEGRVKAKITFWYVKEELKLSYDKVCIQFQHVVLAPPVFRQKPIWGQIVGKKLANFIWYCSTAFPLAENSSASFPQQPGKISCVPKLKSHLHFDKHLFHAWVMCTAQEFSVWFHLHLQTETTLLFPLQTNMNMSSLLVRVISLDTNLRQTVITGT